MIPEQENNIFDSIISYVTVWPTNTEDCSIENAVICVSGTVVDEDPPYGYSTTYPILNFSFQQQQQMSWCWTASQRTQATHQKWSLKQD